MGLLIQNHASEKKEQVVHQDFTRMNSSESKSQSPDNQLSMTP